jgi:hypothetical protein
VGGGRRPPLSRRPAFGLSLKCPVPGKTYHGFFVTGFASAWTKEPSRSESADMRKRREMSSEVFGSDRRIEKSSSSPSGDLWSQTQKAYCIMCKCGLQAASPIYRLRRLPPSSWSGCLDAQMY